MKNKKILKKVVLIIVVIAVLASAVFVYYRVFNPKFSAEKTATEFTKQIVCLGDGYNAYKKTIICKNYEWEEFLEQYYIYPVIYLDSNYEPFMDISDLKGYNDESYRDESNREKNNLPFSKFTDEQFANYLSLMMGYNGWDDYDSVLKAYFDSLKRSSKTSYNDEYITKEFMFEALEANVEDYGVYIGGKTEYGIIDKKLKKVETYGILDKKYGVDCEIEFEIEKTTDFTDITAYVSAIDSTKLELYKISPDEIKEAKMVTVNVVIGGKIRKVIDVYTVKIGNEWYVDNTKTKTDVLYELFDKD